LEAPTMFETLLLEQAEVWNALQQPAKPATAEPSYLLLLAALDSGWMIEEPVCLRSRWGESGPRVYHFILRRSQKRLTQLPGTRLITISAGPEIERFVRDSGLSVTS
jgi:hypothetical protein